MTANNLNLNTMQQRCYYYVNRYFHDNNVSTAGTVCINQEDLDWFINYMLGITDRAGNVLEGKAPFSAPSWAESYTDNTLQIVINNAKELEYKHPSIF